MNFQQLIKDLLNEGMTQAAIGHEIGIKQPSVFDILNGKTKSVRWEVGNKLLALHEREMGKVKK